MSLRRPLYGVVDVMIRRAIWRAAARRCGHGLQI
jgi:hypothetical protein